MLTTLEKYSKYSMCSLFLDQASALVDCIILYRLFLYPPWQQSQEGPQLLSECGRQGGLWLIVRAGRDASRGLAILQSEMECSEERVHVNLQQCSGAWLIASWVTSHQCGWRPFHLAERSDRHSVSQMYKHKYDSSRADLCLWYGISNEK